MTKTEMNLTQIRETELGILKHFRDFCAQAQIRWCLSNGTLLGAVKYGGFIPWDDDIDVFVPRADYDRLVKTYRDSDRYRLFSPERDRHYRFPFAKLCDMTTEKAEDNVANGVRLGVDIDIFPLDAWDEDADAARRQTAAQKKNIARLTFFKCARAISVNPVKRLVKNVVLTLCRPVCGLYVRKMDRIARANAAAERPVWLGCVAWCIYGHREILPAEVFDSLVPVCFEGEEFPAPAGYDRYLRSLYGDYTQDPPPEKQVTHHHYRAYHLKGGNTLER